MSWSQAIRRVPLVSVVVPTHNRKSAAMRCVESLLQSDYPSIEVIVVDDASTDGTAGHLSSVFPKVDLIRFERPQMVSRSRNAGCMRAKGEFVFLVDDDNVVQSNTVSELVKAFSDNPRAGIAGPIMYYLRNPGLVWCSGVNRNFTTSITKFSTEKPNGSMDCYLTDDIPNAFMIKKRVLDEVGDFDQVGFPQHLAEGDFCMRATRKGFDAIMVPKATVWHDVPVRKWPYRGSRNLHMSSRDRTYDVARSRIRFMRKYAGPWKFAFFTIAFLPPIALSYLTTLMRQDDLGDPRGTYAESYVRGLIDGFTTTKSTEKNLAFSS